MRRFGESRWPWLIAMAFVVLTLAALVFIPLIVQRRVDEDRQRIEASEPARTLVNGLRFNILQEAGSLRDYLQTGDTLFVATFNAARAEENRTFSELEVLAHRMGSPVLDHFVRFRTLVERFHIRMNESEILQRGPGVSSADRQDVGELLDHVLASAAGLDSAIVQVTKRTRAQIERAERRGLRLTLLSGALAFLAAIAVGTLVWRIRRLAAESERRRLETVAALAASARAAEARARLLRGITHDVKNPIGAAKGYAELLDIGVKGQLTPEQREMVHGVSRSLDAALAIITDLLDLARTDSGGINLQRVSVDLRTIVQEAVADHQAVAEKAGHQIACELPETPLQVFTDHTRVRQVLDNLLSNAIKYTPAPGRIMVTAEGNVHDAPRVRRAVAIRVSDSGPGIQPEMREHIFDEFTRLEDTNLKGHGLGLAIARRIARLLGGELGVADSDGRLSGATFVLWLPRREDPPPD